MEAGLAPGAADGLIDLLQAQEYAGGQSMWDRTLLYVASDFGHSKGRLANAEKFWHIPRFNNGVLLVSPLVRGNAVLGGVDPNTAMTYGAHLVGPCRSQAMRPSSRGCPP